MRGARTSDLTVVLAAATAMGVIATLDYLTGHEISFSVFYLLPVGLLAWRTTLAISLVAAVLSAALWYGADVVTHEYSHPAVGVWNALVRLTIFVFAGVVLHRLKRLLKLEQTLARTDSQTGVFNARAFTELLDAELLRSERTGRSFSLVFMDLDHFKAVNDRFGHAAGDEVLREVSKLLAASVRGNDFVGRLGGDEFAILLTEADAEQTQSAIDRIQRDLRQTLGKMPWASDVRVTASLGAIVHQAGTKLSSREVLMQADALMYQAKQGGRDRWVLGASGT